MATDYNLERATFSAEDLIYASGFFDGEGCVNITKALQGPREPQYRMQVTITNTFMPILEWLQVRFGGKIYQASRDRGIVNTPFACWFLAWTGREAADRLQLFLPHLIVKRHQALNAIAFQATKSPVRGRGTPPDIRAKQEQHWLIGRQLHTRTGDGVPEVLIVDDGIEQLELVENE